MRITAVVILFLLSFSLFAQKETIETKINYRIKVFSPGKKSFYGFLYSVSDSAIFVVHRLRNSQVMVVDSINFSEISKLRIIKKNRGGNAFLIGAGATVGIGLIGASTIRNDNFERFFVVLGSVLTAPFIGGISAAIASFTFIEMEIDGDYSTFSNARDFLNARSRMQSVE